MSDNNPKIKDDLTEQEALEINKTVLGEKVEELELAQIKKITEILKEKGSFLDAYKNIENKILKKDRSEIDIEEIDDRIGQIVAKAILKNKLKIKDKIGECKLQAERYEKKAKKESTKQNIEEAKKYNKLADALTKLLAIAQSRKRKVKFATANDKNTEDRISPGDEFKFIDSHGRKIIGTFVRREGGKIYYTEGNSKTIHGIDPTTLEYMIKDYYQSRETAWATGLMPETPAQVNSVSETTESAVASTDKESIPTAAPESESSVPNEPTLLPNPLAFAESESASAPTSASSVPDESAVALSEDKNPLAFAEWDIPEPAATANDEIIPPPGDEGPAWPDKPEIPKETEEQGLSAVPVKPIPVQDVLKYHSPREVIDFLDAYWANVVTRFDRKPRGDEKDLYFKNSDKSKDKVKLDEKEVKDYKDYIKFSTEIRKFSLDLIVSKVNDCIPDLQKMLNNKMPQPELDAKIEDATTNVVNALLEASPVGIKIKSFNSLDKKAKKQLLLTFIYSTLGVDNDSDAFSKINNIIKLNLISSARKGKEIFKEAKDTEGNTITIGLEEFLKTHGEYGETMVERTHEALYKLYEMYGEKTGKSLTEFRDILIEVVKTRGGKQFITGQTTVINPMTSGANWAASSAYTTQTPLNIEKEIYSSFLVIKERHLGEKEALALLIAFKENPPSVYELRNTGKGWETIGEPKTGPSVFEDFCMDGIMYEELKFKLGMKKTEFNIFIQKIAPNFELIRSIFENKAYADDEARMTAVKTYKLDEKDFAKFKELMTVPLWMDKIAGAFKYSLYDHGGQKVPQIDEIQGADREGIDIMFVDIEEKLQRIAERLADERLDQELKEMGPQGWKDFFRIRGYSGLVRKFWKRSAYAGYREKYVEEYKLRLKEDPKYRTELMSHPGNLVKPAKNSGKGIPNEGTRDDKLNGELDRIAERFGIAFGSAEKDSYLTSNESIEDVQEVAIQAAIKKLSQDYIDGKINDLQFKNEVRTNIIPMVKNAKGTTNEIVAFLEGNQEKTGLLDKLNAHKAGLIYLELDNMRLHLGTAKNVDVKTQNKDLNWFDKFSTKVVGKLQKSKFLGRFINPSTVAIIGFGLGNITAQMITGKYMRYGVMASLGVLAPWAAPALAGIATGCILGGGFAALRENEEAKYRKAQKERRDALGFKPGDDKKGLRPNQASESRYERQMEKRKKGEEILYHKESATSLCTKIDTAMNSTAPNKFDLLRDSLAHTIALNEISEFGINQPETIRIDLIKFDEENSIESQRLEMLHKVAQGKVMLKQLALAGGKDPIMELQTKIANERTEIINNPKNGILMREKNFLKFKMYKNFRAMGIGALIGGSIAGIGTLVGKLAGVTEHNIKNDLTNGKVDDARLQIALIKGGLDSNELAQIKFDAAGNPADQITRDILTSHNINITPTVTSIPGVITDIAGGKTLDVTGLQAELAKIPGIDMSQVTFDAAGHIDPASLAYLKLQNITINEIASGVGGVSLSKSGFNILKNGVHFNDNQPHGPGHILDELRLWWKGTPQLEADGNYHFSMKGMVDQNLAHSHLPSGVAMPVNPQEYGVALQMTEGGKHVWKFFTPDATTGEVRIPKEFMGGNVGYVPKGGSVLPGLKTESMAVGFMDKNDTFQVLASVKGDGSFVPNPTDIIGFTGKIAEAGTNDVTFEAIQDFSSGAMAIPPFIVGAPMNHLEYGKAKQKRRPPVVPPIPRPPKPPKKPEETEEPIVVTTPPIVVTTPPVVPPEETEEPIVITTPPIIIPPKKPEDTEEKEEAETGEMKVYVIEALSARLIRKFEHGKAITPELVAQEKQKLLESANSDMDLLIRSISEKLTNKQKLVVRAAENRIQRILAPRKLDISKLKEDQEKIIAAMTKELNEMTDEEVVKMITNIKKGQNNPEPRRSKNSKDIKPENAEVKLAADEIVDSPIADVNAPKTAEKPKKLGLKERIRNAGSAIISRLRAIKLRDGKVDIQDVEMAKKEVAQATKKEIESLPPENGETQEKLSAKRSELLALLKGRIASLDAQKLLIEADKDIDVPPLTETTEAILGHRTFIPKASQIPKASPVEASTVDLARPAEAPVDAPTVEIPEKVPSKKLKDNANHVIKILGEAIEKEKKEASGIYEGDDYVAAKKNNEAVKFQRELDELRDVMVSRDENLITSTLEKIKKHLRERDHMYAMPIAGVSPTNSEAKDSISELPSSPASNPEPKVDEAPDKGDAGKISTGEKATVAKKSFMSRLKGLGKMFMRKPKEGGEQKAAEAAVAEAAVAEAPVKPKEEVAQAMPEAAVTESSVKPAESAPVKNVQAPEFTPVDILDGPTKDAIKADAEYAAEEVRRMMAEGNK